MERDHLEIQLKNERDERELYKVSITLTKFVIITYNMSVH